MAAAAAAAVAAASATDSTKVACDVTHDDLSSECSGLVNSSLMMVTIKAAETALAAATPLANSGSANRMHSAVLDEVSAPPLES